MTIYLIAGHAGTGKSTLGRALAAHLRCAVLDKDTMCRPLVEACNAALGVDPHDRASATYLNRVRPLEYAALHDTIFEVAVGAGDVVAVAPWLGYVDDPAWAAEMGAQARRTGHGVIVVWATCTDAALKGRLARRDDPADWSKLDSWTDFVDGRAAAAPAFADMVIDTTVAPVRDSVAEVLTAAGHDHRSRVR